MADKLIYERDGREEAVPAPALTSVPAPVPAPGEAAPEGMMGKPAPSAPPGDSPPGDSPPRDSQPGDSQPSQPGDLPRKFWDGRRGEVRVDRLVKSYNELERKLGAMVNLPGEGATAEEIAGFHKALGVPESPDDYEIEVRDELVDPDPDVNQRLHEAGFTPAQAQVVYDLAAERLLPMIEDAASEFESQRQIDRLTRHFGGEEKWHEASRQLLAWGKSNLPENVLDALSTTYEGVLTLNQMMTSGEPAMLRGGTAAANGPEEAELRRMMRDPRYWRDRDPATIDKVTAGFRRIYGDET